MEEVNSCAQNGMQAGVSESLCQPASVSTWVGRFLLLFIPLVNIVLLFVWSFQGEKPTNLRNFARGQLVILAVSFLLLFIFYGIFFAILFGSGLLD